MTIVHCRFDGALSSSGYACPLARNREIWEPWAAAARFVAVCFGIIDCLLPNGDRKPAWAPQIRVCVQGYQMDE